MKRKLITLALAVVFTLSTAGLGMAAKVKCVVDTVEGDKVTMTCKKADKLKVGDKVKVSAKKGAAVEGC
jgi:hypothetical protein